MDRVAEGIVTVKRGGVEEIVHIEGGLKMRRKVKLHWSSKADSAKSTLHRVLVTAVAIYGGW